MEVRIPPTTSPQKLCDLPSGDELWVTRVTWIVHPICEFNDADYWAAIIHNSTLPQGGVLVTYRGVLHGFVTYPCPLWALDVATELTDRSWRPPDDTDELTLIYPERQPPVAQMCIIEPQRYVDYPVTVCGQAMTMGFHFAGNPGPLLNMALGYIAFGPDMTVGIVAADDDEFVPITPFLPPILLAGLLSVCFTPVAPPKNKHGRKRQTSPLG